VRDLSFTLILFVGHRIFCGWRSQLYSVYSVKCLDERKEAIGMGVE